MEHKSKVAVIGAGLAGCSIAYELGKSKKFHITVFDKNSDIAQDASGNYAGILAPKLTIDNNYSDQFHTLGYQLLTDFISNYKDRVTICSKGVLQLLTNDKETLRYKKIFDKRNISNDLAQLLSKEETANILGKATSHNSVYYPNALSLEPKSLCELWMRLSEANFQPNKTLTNITKLKNHNHNWQLEFNQEKECFDVVIFAGGYKPFEKLPYISDIPVFASYGQLTVIDSTYDISHTIMDKGYIIPNYRENSQVIGATFRDNTDSNTSVRDEDDKFNISQIKEMLADSKNSQISITDSRLATRCVTADHIPLVGKLVDYEKFKDDFYKPLSKGYPKSKMPKISYEEGLYLASGFGSKGLCSSLLSAKIIFSQITNQELPISEKLLQALSPQRFWVRSFKKC